jgi:hypothetical protein
VNFVNAPVGTQQSLADNLLAKLWANCSASRNGASLSRTVLLLAKAPALRSGDENS